MPLPFPKNQVRRLGQRLRIAEVPGDDDLAMLEELLAAYDEALNAVVNAIRDALAVSPSQRLKNTGTIIEKLRRSSATHLANIHDLAGARIVHEGGSPVEQDQLVARLSELFRTRGWEHHLIDRRLDPMQGYRAVHVVVRVDQLPVEVQVRTAWQHQWAEFYEKVADRLGRNIRYSSEVDADDVLAALRLPPTVPDGFRSAITEAASAIVRMSLALSDALVETEAALVAGAETEQVEAVVTKCNGLMQQAVELLDSFATHPRTDAIRHGREL